MPSAPRGVPARATIERFAEAWPDLPQPTRSAWRSRGGEVKAELVSVGQSGEQSLKRIESAGECASGGLEETNFPVQYIGAKGFLADAPRNKLYIGPPLPQWLPDLAVYDRHIGKHKLDIRFWREGEDTTFEVIKGDSKLVERCNVVSKIAQLKSASDPF